MSTSAPPRFLVLGCGVVDVTIGADDRVVEYFGGIGRNVACNLATLGAPVTLAGAISAPKDAFATDLVRRGVTPLPLAEATVGRITTRLGPDGRRRLIDRHLPAPDTFAAPLPDAVCDIATDACCVLVETGLDLTGIEQLCGVARDCHAVTVGLVTRAFDREAHASLRPGVFDWVLLNQHELCLVTGEPGVEAAARSLAAALGANLAVTLAEQGALIVDHQECLRLPAPPAEVVDELGAGDAFSARFAYGLVNGESPRDCAAHGMVDASRALAVVGAVAPRTEENTQ